MGCLRACVPCCRRVCMTGFFDRPSGFFLGLAWPCLPACVNTAAITRAACMYGPTRTGAVRVSGADGGVGKRGGGVADADAAGGRAGCAFYYYYEGVPGKQRAMRSPEGGRERDLQHVNMGMEHERVTTQNQNSGRRRRLSRDSGGGRRAGERGLGRNAPGHVPTLGGGEGVYGALRFVGCLRTE